MSSELREVFEMVTKQTEPEPDARWEQERRQRRRSRNRKLGALAIATTIGIVAVVVSLVSLSRTAEPPADEPTPRPTPARLGSLAYAVRGDIFVADWDGANPVRIADGRPPSDCGGSDEYWWEGPIWSPDGRYLAYRHTDCDGARGAWSDVVISDPEGNVVASFPSEGWGISWSPDSTRVAVWVHWERGEIGVFGPDGERQTLIVPPGMMAPPGTKAPSGPRWSPDGASLRVKGGVVVPLDGSTPWKLPSGDLRSLASLPQATYSPDGSRVAYTTSGSLVVAAADGSDARHLVERWVRSPVWSPTGDRIAFTWGARAAAWRGNATELRVLDVATGRMTVLVEAGGSVMLSGAASAPFEFSPEGDRILFSGTEVEDGTFAYSLWSVNVDGSNLRRLVAGTDWGDWLSPSPMR
jgi:Tol biopolymer transport system component